MANVIICELAPMKYPFKKQMSTISSTISCHLDPVNWFLRQTNLLGEIKCFRAESIDQCNEIETFKEVLSGLVVPIFMSKPPAAPLMERGWPRDPSVDISKQFLLSPNLSRLNLFSGRRGGGLEVI